MKRFVKGIFMLVLLTLVLVACSQSKQEQSQGNENSSTTSTETSIEKVSLEMATFTEGTSWYVYGAVMSEMLRDGIEEIERVDVLPYAGGLGNVEIISYREADLGFTFSVNNAWAVNGEAAFEGESHDDLRLLVSGLDQYYVGILMPTKFVNEHGITSIADIKEKEIPVRLQTLAIGSQGEYAMRQILEVYGMSYEDIVSYGGSVEHTTLDVTKTDFQNERVDMYLNPITKGHPAYTEIAIQNDVTFISLEDEYIEKLKEYGYEMAVLPANEFNGQDYEVKTIGFSTAIDTHAGMSEDLAYKITKVLIENEDKLKEGHQALNDFDPQRGLEGYSGTGQVKLHPGAEKYYREIGWIE